MFPLISTFDRLRHILLVIFFTFSVLRLLYPLSLHDALPISSERAASSPTRTRTGTASSSSSRRPISSPTRRTTSTDAPPRSEEHTSELQSRGHLVCRLLLEKK